ncbi:MAG TPA: hypothetical protein VIU61_02960, partial [Kofleriaceae bacterium]
RVQALPAATTEVYDWACKQLWATDLTKIVDGADPTARLLAERKAGRGGSERAVAALAAIAFERAAGDIAAGATSTMPGLQLKGVQQSPIDLARAEARVQTGSVASDLDAVKLVLALDPNARLAHEALLKRMSWREGLVPAMKRFEAVLAQPQRTLDMLFALRKYRDASADTTDTAVRLLADLLELFNRDPRRVEAAVAGGEDALVLDAPADVEVPVTARSAYVRALDLLDPARKRPVTDRRKQDTRTTTAPTTSSTPRIIPTIPKDQVGEVATTGAKGEWTEYVVFTPGPDDLEKGTKNVTLMTQLLMKYGVDQKVAVWMATYAGPIDPLTGGPHQRTDGGYRGFAIRNADQSIMSEERIDTILVDHGKIALRLRQEAIDLGTQLLEKFGTNLEAWVSMDVRMSTIGQHLAELEKKLADNPDDQTLKQQVDALRGQVNEGFAYSDKLRTGQVDAQKDRDALDKALATVDEQIRKAQQDQQRAQERLAAARTEMAKVSQRPESKNKEWAEAGTVSTSQDAQLAYDQARQYVETMRAERAFLAWRKDMGLPLPQDYDKAVQQRAAYFETSDGSYRRMSSGESITRTMGASLNSLGAMGLRFGGGVLRDMPAGAFQLDSIPGAVTMREQLGRGLIDWAKSADEYSDSERKHASRVLGENGVAVVDFLTQTAVLMVVTWGIGSLGAAAGRMVMVGGRLVAVGSKGATMAEIAGSGAALGTFGFFQVSDKSLGERLLNATAMALSPLFGNKGGVMRKMAAGFVSNMALDAANQIEYTTAFKHFLATKDLSASAQLGVRNLEKNWPQIFMSGVLGLTAGFSRTPKPRANLEVTNDGTTTV